MVEICYIEVVELWGCCVNDEGLMLLVKFCFNFVIKGFL